MVIVLRVHNNVVAAVSAKTSQLPILVPVYRTARCQSMTKIHIISVFSPSNTRQLLTSLSSPLASRALHLWPEPTLCYSTTIHCLVTACTYSYLASHRIDCSCLFFTNSTCSLPKFVPTGGGLREGKTQALRSHHYCSHIHVSRHGSDTIR